MQRTPLEVSARAAAPPRATRRVRDGIELLARGVRAASPGDVVLDGLGLRQSADPLTPARFDLLAEPRGRYRRGVHAGRRATGAWSGSWRSWSRETVTPRPRDR